MNNYRAIGNRNGKWNRQIFLYMVKPFLSNHLLTLHCTVDPRLSRPHESGCSDYLNCVVTVLLECLVKSVRSIRVFEWGSI